MEKLNNHVQCENSVKAVWVQLHFVRGRRNKGLQDFTQITTRIGFHSIRDVTNHARRPVSLKSDFQWAQSNFPLSSGKCVNKPSGVKNMFLYRAVVLTFVFLAFLGHIARPIWSQSKGHNHWPWGFYGFLFTLLLICYMLLHLQIRDSNSLFSGWKYTYHQRQRSPPRDYPNYPWRHHLQTDTTSIRTPPSGCLCCINSVCFVTYKEAGPEWTGLPHAGWGREGHAGEREGQDHGP